MAVAVSAVDVFRNVAEDFDGVGGGEVAGVAIEIDAGGVFEIVVFDRRRVAILDIDKSAGAFAGDAGVFAKRTARTVICVWSTAETIRSPGPRTVESSMITGSAVLTVMAGTRRSWLIHVPRYVPPWVMMRVEGSAAGLLQPHAKAARAIDRTMRYPFSRRAGILRLRGSTELAEVHGLRRLNGDGGRSRAHPGRRRVGCGRDLVGSGSAVRRGCVTFSRGTDGYP